MDKSIHSDQYRLIIAKIRNRRERMGMTQRQFAEKLKVNQCDVSKIETCERRIDIIELRTICRTLDLAFVDFLIEIEEEINNL